ncbi:MAG: hypothetical protein PHN19_02555 [Patescibacteria group bacterium]|nr:hypothetical protein [Patescibacteria group bacterium]
MKKTILFCLALFFTSCAIDKEDKCEICVQTVSCENIGWLNFGDRDNIDLINECGFEYNNGEKGGYGHTLQEKGCNESMLLIWANGGLKNAYLSADWAGETNRGTKINDSLAEFRKAYPEAVKSDFESNNEYELWKVITYKPYPESLDYCSMHFIFDRQTIKLVSIRIYSY